ncbi:MAG: 50S ribosomal protein L11 methyltransferase [Acidobacteriota bacterium]|jgi:ribosomal protein L11 methyltransferase
MSSYLAVACELASASEEKLTETMAAWPVLGCQVEDVAPGRVLVTVYLEQFRAAALSGIERDLLALGATRLARGELPDADWLAEYRRRVTPRAVGSRFWIDPHPAQPTPAPEGRIHLLIEPRQAFGTGSHESTALVLQCLEQMSLAGRSVLDVGTGSSILALAAAALGARPVVGFDIDLEAVFVARQTVREQPTRPSVALFAGPVEALGAAARFDVVLANLLPAQLDPILPELIGHLGGGGELVVSGLLASQRTVSEAELARAGLQVTAALSMGEWVALRCRRRLPTP